MQSENTTGEKNTDVDTFCCPLLVRFSVKGADPSHNRAQTEKPSTVRLARLLGLVLPVFRQYRLRIIIGCTSLLVVDFLQLIIPRILKRGVDELAAGTSSETALLRLAGLIILIAIAVNVLRFVWRYMIIGFSRILERIIRDRIFSHILKMDALFFEKHTTGDIMAHASNDLTAVQMACGMGLIAAMDALFMSLAAIGFMMHIHFYLTLLAILPMPFLALCTRILSGKLHQRFATVQEQFSLMTEFTRSTLVSIRLIKTYTMEKFRTSEFNTLGKKYVRSNLRVAMVQGLMFPIATLAGSIGMLFVLLFGGGLVIRNRITMGDLVAFISYLYMLVWPMMAIGWVANLVQRGITSLRRIDALLSSAATLPDIQTTEEMALEPIFSLRSLTFSYPSSTQPVLRDITLEIGPGIHGVAGRTGSGKSSLCRILARLYPVRDGQVFFGGRDVNCLPLGCIRSSLGYVGQEPIVFSDTIGANIRLGRPDADQHEIEIAARHAAIHDDIINFPDGYNTLIGERGIKLSGGQRQRLALARALLCDRPILLIDDGLSAVDVATEHEVFAGLRSQLQKKTVLIVSNRIKLLSMTDHIIILDEGRIVSDGTHTQLVRENTFYRSMYEKQMRGEDALEDI
jgi:ATP-binding cassette, subfamily B, multidrug efflux pump